MSYFWITRALQSEVHSAMQRYVSRQTQQPSHESHLTLLGVMVGDLAFELMMHLKSVDELCIVEKVKRTNFVLVLREK